jgi:hypothetical protein
MNTLTAPKSAREFSSLIRKEIRRRIPGAKVTSIRTRSVRFPTGARGYVSTGTATARGRKADFCATGVETGFQVTFTNETMEG